MHNIYNIYIYIKCYTTVSPLPYTSDVKKRVFFKNVFFQIKNVFFMCFFRFLLFFSFFMFFSILHY